MKTLEAAAVARVSVVLVDSDTDTRRAVQLGLRAGAFNVRAYASGLAMLADVPAAGPDCIVVRDTMSEIGGFELLRQMRGRGWHGPAILLSSMLNPELAEAATCAGFVAVIDRPLVDNVVLNAVVAATRISPEIAA